MATYYPTSNNQRDVMPSLYLRDPAPPATSYPESQVLPANMMMYMNYPSSAGSYADSLAGNSQPQQNLEIPSVGASELASQQGMFSNLVGTQAGNQNYSLWRDGRNEMLFMQPMGAPTSMQSIGASMNGGTDDLVHGSASEDSQMGLRTRLGVLQSGHNLQGQGLSLSLSTQIPSAIPVPSFQYRHPSQQGLSSFLSSHPSISGGAGNGNGSRDDEGSHSKQLRSSEYMSSGYPGGNHDSIKEETLNSFMCAVGPKHTQSADPSSFGISSLGSAIANSRYLKVTQQLLDEVVNVNKAIKQHEAEKQQGFGPKGSKETDEKLKDGSPLPTDAQDMTTSPTSELTPTERQDLQNKMTKLLSMLDEVDRRYKQYYHQMQIVVSSFDVIAGCGAAKPYTALALQTISRHFRCLRDAISDQIKAARKSLGEIDTAGNSKGGGISRLRFVDQQLRQQRAIQQLGMMQQHAWRPQRGLPESSVSILRAWLFEHFLHPYPKDSDKIMLARQTGLTRSQVSNWFINARVRLWKPMVEEMYKEEFGDNEMDSNSSSENASKAARDSVKISDDRREEFQQHVKSATDERCNPRQFHQQRSDFMSDIDMSGPSVGTSFQNSAHEDETTYIKFGDAQRTQVDDCSLLQDAFVQSDGSGNGRFMAAANAAYQMAELGRFGSTGNGVSLTLGLQHCDGTGALPMSGGAHQSFVTMRADDMYNAATSLGSDTGEYDCMDPGNRRNRFGSSSMLHDFVA